MVETGLRFPDRKRQMTDIFFVSLGCDKNLVDSERMLGILNRAGFKITDDEKSAQVIVINTCCFIDEAKEESINTILEMAQYKSEGSCEALIVTGCMAQRYREEILKEIPEVDAIVGTTALDRIASVVSETLKKKGGCYFEDRDRPLTREGKRLLTTGGHYAYLKIAEGCDKHCTYCVIPSIRGRYRSYPMEDLIDEAGELAESGVKELILVAQDTARYGCDIYGGKKLHELISRLCEIPSLRWIRILYCYPEEIYPELIDVMAREPKCLPYLDIPIQHADNRILKRMNRRTSREDIEKLIAKLRRRIPDITLRTSLITGFPGETREEHEALLAFVNEAEFDRLGVFTYSAEEGTPAEKMPDQIPEDIKMQRRDELMELQQEIAFEKAQAKVGSRLEVMVEGKVADENVYVCRTKADAPGVDGYLFLNTDETMMSGDFAMVTVTGAHEYDLIGELCDD